MIIKFFNTFDGVWSDITGTANQSLVYNDTSGWVTARPFTIYAASFNQTGSNDPTTKIHQNTVGEIEWTRLSAGSYQGKLIGAFTGDVPYQIMMLGQGSGAPAIWVSIERVDDDDVRLKTRDGNTLQDGLLTDSFFEFKVY
jgi:hypothetical protein